MDHQFICNIFRNCECVQGRFVVISVLDYFFATLNGNRNSTVGGNSSSKTNENHSQFVSNCLQWVSSSKKGDSVASSGHRPILGFEKAANKGLSPALLNNSSIAIYLVDGAGPVGFSPRDVK